MNQYQSMLNEIDWLKALKGVLVGAVALNAPALDTSAQAGPPPYSYNQKVSDKDIVAKVIAGEAAGEGYEGMLAVANVIQNRMKQSGFTAEQVVNKKGQFSSLKSPASLEARYQEVKKTADEIAGVIGGIGDTTGGATHFVTKKLYDEKKNDPSSWISKMEVRTTIGNHVFMKEKK